MTTSTSLSGRRGLGGFVALAAGALMVASVFLPWLNSPLGAGGSVTGWDTYEQASGGEQWFVQETFSSGFSPWFTGISLLIAGGLLALIGLAMLASLRGGAFRLPVAGIIVLGLMALLIFIVGITNLVSLYATGDSDLMTPAYGLFLLTAGATAGLLGVWVGVGRGRSA
jgi:hypothetical protein